MADSCARDIDRWLAARPGAPFSHVTAGNENTFEQCGYTREVYAVDGTRVTLDGPHGWQCTCTADTQDIRCAHIEHAQALRLKRALRRDEDTVEFELTAEQLEALTRAAAVEHTDSDPAEDVSRANRLVRRSPWASLAAAAAISAISSGITYLAVNRTQPVAAAGHGLSASLTVPAPQLARPHEVAVRFVNPFDATEAFEFPPGTSASGAREAVAELLLKRAQARLTASADLRVPTGKIVNREKPVRRRMTLAQRS